jgi:hypothetical protein
MLLEGLRFSTKQRLRKIGQFFYSLHFFILVKICPIPYSAKTLSKHKNDKVTMLVGWQS